MKKKENIVNILLISLDDKFAKNVAIKLADSLDMFVADCREIIEYDLVDSKAVLKTCGLEYFKKRERKAVQKFKDYENTVLTINIDLFKEYAECFDKSIVVYLARKRKSVTKIVSQIGFDNYDEFIKNNVDFSVDCEKYSAPEGAEKIMQKMRENL